MRLNACRDIGTRVSTNIELNNKKRKGKQKNVHAKSTHIYSYVNEFSFHWEKQVLFRV